MLNQMSEIYIYCSMDKDINVGLSMLKMTIIN